jgi:hypothetical protein
MNPCDECERLNHEWAKATAAVDQFKREHRHELDAWAEQVALLEMAQWEVLVVFNHHCKVHKPEGRAVVARTHLAN